MVSKRSVTFKIEKDLDAEIQTYADAHGLNYTQALHARDKENRQRIAELTSENTSLKEKEVSIHAYLKEKGLSEDAPSQNTMSTVTETPKHSSKPFSDVACPDLDYLKGKAVCLNLDAPIPSFVKRSLTPRACMRCQKKRNKELEEAQKQEEKQRKLIEKQRRDIHRGAERIKDTLAEQNSRKRSEPFTNEHGERIKP